MKIASVTITSNRENLIEDCLNSVKDHVDFAVICDMGITDATISKAIGIMGEDKVFVVKSDMPEHIGNWRNFGIQKAHEFGADWALILDTDERMIFGDADIHRDLEQSPADLILIPCKPMNGGLSYCKERFFRLPAKDLYEGDLHECVKTTNGRRGVYSSGPVYFTELPKTKEQLKLKLEAIVRIIKKKLRVDPENSRWWYYLGDAYDGLGDDANAMKAFKRCIGLRGDPEPTAWTCVRLAALQEKNGKIRDAIETCALGLAINPGTAELAFIAAAVCLNAGKFHNAIYWARMATVNGEMGCNKQLIPRVHWKLSYGLKRGPFDILIQAYSAIGMEKEANSIKDMFGDDNGQI